MVEGYNWNVYRESRVTGCVMEDESDTRKYEEEIILIPDHYEEEYHENLVDEYGSQDYSYQFSTKKIAELNHKEILEIAYKWIMALELSDIVNDKEKFKKIAEKLNHCIKAMEE